MSHQCLPAQGLWHLERTSSKHWHLWATAQHAKASAYTIAATQDYLEANNIQLVTHTLYSLGIASSDFFLLLQMKQQLKQFQGVKNTQAFFNNVISDRLQWMRSGAMVTWLERMTKCMYAEEGYWSLHGLTWFSMWASNHYLRCRESYFSANSVLILYKWQNNNKNNKKQLQTHTYKFLCFSNQCTLTL